MPWGLKRFQQARSLHFLTFSCYHRAPLLATPEARCIFEQTLERVRQWYGFYVAGYVVMPEHVHLLVSEPERGKLSLAIQMLKQITAHKLKKFAGEGPFWQERYYDFNVWSERKRVEKLRYLHRNPVTRGLVRGAEDWAWSSFRHYVSGIKGIVEIESQWTARERERMGITLKASRREQEPRPVSPKPGETRTGHPPCLSKTGSDKDGAPAGVDRREGPGQPPSRREQEPRPVSPKPGATRTGHPAP